MLSATLGYWIYYVSAFGFQVLFAARFGTSPEAAGFVVAYGLGMAVTNLLAGTAQSVALPRLAGPHKELLSGGLWLLGRLCVVAAIPGLVGIVFASELAGPVHHALGMEWGLTRDLLWYTGLYVLIQSCAVILGVVALAGGRRFLPALGPALPMVAAAGVVLAWPSLGVAGAFQALVAGAAVQAVVLAGAVRKSVIVSQASSPGTASMTVGTLATLGLVVFLAPFERALTAHFSLVEAAQYDYAIRSLSAVQQLVIGGVLLTALADWSGLAASGDGRRVRESVGRAVVFTAVLLALLVSLAMVGARWAVALAYERGQFTTQDTDAVAGLVLLALPGFWAEGVGSVVTRAVLAVRRNWVAIWIGVAHAVLRVTLLSLLVPLWGGAGTAAAYSITMVVIFLGQVVLSFRLSLLDWPRTDTLWKWVVISTGTIATASALAIYTRAWSFWLNGLIVITVFAVLLALFRAVEPLRLGR